MAKYELLQIACGKETVLYTSDKPKDIKRRYDQDKLQRIRIDGKMLLIYQAFDWVQGRPIKEYKPKKAKVKVESSNPHNWKPVIKINSWGSTIKRFKSLTDAAVECGYGSAYDITKACNTGLPTSRGDFFKWGAER